VFTVLVFQIVTLAEGTTTIAGINKLEAAADMKFLRSRGEDLGK